MNFPDSWRGKVISTYTSAWLLIASWAWHAVAWASEPDLTLSYDEPARVWTEALPVGNGRIGAMVFGGSEEERVQINEGTLWGGQPHDYAKPGSDAQLAEIRRLIFAGRVDEAEALSQSLMGRPKVLMPYQPFCDLRLHFSGQGQATEYHRALHLEDAIAETIYRVGEVRYRREVFVSYPDQVLVVRITASVPGQVTFSVGMDSAQEGVRVDSPASDTLQLKGRIQPRQNPQSSWTASWDRPGMGFAAVLKVVADGGKVRHTGDHLSIEGADSVTLVFSNGTSFRNYRNVGADALSVARGFVQRALQHPYEQLRKRHVEDFQRLFSRVRLNLGEPRSNLTTDRRIKDFATNEDPSLLALHFEFGRYLLISASRPGGQPANLQGIWNADLQPAWSSKWTTNINLQMNYWQADAGDLWETQQPLWDLIRDLRVSGAKTARLLYRSQGWVLHHNTDLWRATAPVDGPWGIWPMGSVWLANQMWDHYLFSGDVSFLRQQGYPAMREAAQFVLGILVEAPPGTPFAGRLVTNPSTSPENQYVLGGKPEHLTYAPTMDIELIRELFDNTRQAGELLDADADLRRRMEQARNRLPPLQVGKRGQLQEWIVDYPEAEPAHRHVSHLYSLYPGHDIALETTPEWAAAAKKTLEIRGDGGTGWSEVWRTALWARLRNAERAYANLVLLINNNTLPNLFDLCPPFQIDGNLGAPAAMMEMLVQSTPGQIRVLPALPRQWPNGFLRGVRVRGGARVDVSWKDGRLVEVVLRSERPTVYQVGYGEISVEARVDPAHAAAFDGGLRRVSGISAR